MAQAALRLRRVLSLSPNILFHARLTPTVTTTTTAAAITVNTTPSSLLPSQALHRRNFHSTHLLSLASSSRSFNDSDFDPEAVLFEGCDYKHWLIVMDFGKDPSQRPPPDQMVETYINTCAKVVGSVEEAKKKIYACSTTTYTGFQVEVDEATSQKFEELPGVIFVLPDSYIDPVNKEYGGDKFVNGEIIPRPPPVLYARRKRVENRSTGQLPYQQGDSTYNQQGPVPRDGGRYMALGRQQGYPSQQHNPSQQHHPSQQHYPSQQHNPSQQQHPPQQNYESFGQEGRGSPIPSGSHHPGGIRNSYLGGQTTNLPPHQGNSNHGYNFPQVQMSNHPSLQGGYTTQGQMSNHSGPQVGYIPQGQMSNPTSPQVGYTPHGQMSNHPNSQVGYTPQGGFNNYSGGHGYNNSQGQISNRPGGLGGYSPQGQTAVGVNGTNYTSSSGAGALGQSGAGPYVPGPPGSYSQGAGTGFDVGHMPHGENQRFPQASHGQSNTMEGGTYTPGLQTGFNQGRDR